MFRSFLSNFTFFFRISRILKIMKGLEPDMTTTLIDDIEGTVDRLGDKTAIADENGPLTFSEFDARANQYANWALDQGIKGGDVVALMMENCVDYPAIWYGLGKVGVITALINSNLEGKGLAHCINIVNSKMIIASGIQAARASECGIENVQVWDLDGENGQDLSKALDAVSNERPARDHRAHLIGKDTALYIYTSGTTGLPKAARIPHVRLSRTARMPVAMCDLSDTDVNYNVLPLYHMTGGILGMGGALLTGSTSIIRKQFSASGFWTDVHNHEATVFFYVGELCRYLVNSAPHDLEQSHNLRAGVGNGVRGGVWRKFVDRFKVGNLYELYGSTEGNVAFLNTTGTIGSVGQMPPFFGKKLGVDFVKFDMEEEMPVRDADGRCIRAEFDEVAEVIGRIEDTGLNKFDGYHDKKATEAKILRDVFEIGDKWFRTGDLMKRDRDGHIYFVDRIGDTYRWKGENVATNEVSDVMSSFAGIETANVYGVKVPGTDGRAGMAALTLSGDDLDFQAYHDYITDNMPHYAVPLFLRVQKAANITGNYKFQKVVVQKEGFDINALEDDIWFKCPEAKTYIPLTSLVHDRILKENYRY